MYLSILRDALGQVSLISQLVQLRLLATIQLTPKSARIPPLSGSISATTFSIMCNIAACCVTKNKEVPVFRASSESIFSMKDFTVSHSLSKGSRSTRTSSS